MLVQMLEEYDDYDKLYRNLNIANVKFKKMDIKSSGNQVIRDTILFSIRMLKNQIKKLKEYKIFPDLKLEKN